MNRGNFSNSTFYAESYLNQAKFVTFKGPRIQYLWLQKKGVAIKSFKQSLKEFCRATWKYVRAVII